MCYGQTCRNDLVAVCVKALISTVKLLCNS